MWRDQFDWVYRECDYAVFPLTIHPDVSGRPQVLLMLERLIEHIGRHRGVRWCTMEEMAEDFRRRHPFRGYSPCYRSLDGVMRFDERSSSIKM
jgi:peptidoglycan-N-acetylglucosamine deacetylase